VTFLLERLREILEAIGYQVEEGSAQDDKGRTIEILGLAHGPHRVIGLDQGKIVELIYPMDVRAEQAALLAKWPDELLDRLLALLKREMLEGRSGYTIAFGPENPKALRQIRVSQRLILHDANPQTLQRVADAIQEIVVVSVRCQLILGEAIRSAETAARTADSTFHPGMYA
jgi:hypothetical protein